MADLSNYSAKALVEEWVADRLRGPELLREAVAQDGHEAVIQYGVEAGETHAVMWKALYNSQLIPPKPKPPLKTELELFDAAVRRLYKRNGVRMQHLITEWANGRV